MLFSSTEGCASSTPEQALDFGLVAQLFTDCQMAIDGGITRGQVLFAGQGTLDPFKVMRCIKERSRRVWPEGVSVR